MAHSHSSEEARADVVTTARNAFKLGGSLVLTLGIGFGVRIALRRYLGPEVIGPINFADAFASTAFVFVGLGIETYLRRIVPVHLDGANAFLGSVFLLRAVLSVTTFAVMGAVLTLMGQPPEVRLLVWAYGAAQLFGTFNGTMVALLQSARTVDGLSTINVVAKLLWAAGFVATMVFELPLVGIPLSVAGAELIRLVVCYALARKHVNLRLTWDGAELWKALRGAFPFFVNSAALVVVNRFDVNVLKVQSTDAEIGLYSAAAELAQMTFVLTPMMAGVLMPLLTRTLARGREEYHEMLRRTLELVLTLAFPVSLAIAVGSDFWVHLVLGEQYAAAAWALSILGPNFLLTYAAVVISIALLLSGGEWTVTVTSLASVVVNPLLVVGLVSLADDWGPGGAGAACAMAAVLTELFVLLVMFTRVGRTAMDQRLALVVVKSTLVCVGVFAIDRWLLQPLGPARLLLDAVLYAVLALGSGAVSVKQTLAFARQLRAERSAPGP